MSKKKIAVLVGSLRKESVNRKLANTLAKLAPESLELEIVETFEVQNLLTGAASGNLPDVIWLSRGETASWAGRMAGWQERQALFNLPSFQAAEAHYDAAGARA